MTPRKETEPTKECQEEARKLYWNADSASSRQEGINLIAAFLARRDEARDREVVKRGRSEAFAEAAEICDGYALDGLAAPIMREVRSIFVHRSALASPSPASSEPCPYCLGAGVIKGHECGCGGTP